MPPQYRPPTSIFGPAPAGRNRIGQPVQPDDLAGATDYRQNYGLPSGGVPNFGGGGSPFGGGGSPMLQGPETLKNVMSLLGYQGPQMASPAAVNQPAEAGGSGMGGFLKDNAGALVGGAVGLYDAFSRNQQQNRDRSVAERELARQHQLEDEDRARRKAVDPARAAILKRMLEQAQSAGTYTGYGA